MKWVIVLLVAGVTYLTACSMEPTTIDNGGVMIPEEEGEENEGAKVLSVATNEGEGSYTFSVEIKSPDTGCDQYANWWEVITEDGQLIYRRILGHSHVDEQPFVRSGGVVDIESDQVVIVRAHMNNLGNGTSAQKGSVIGGFTTVLLEAYFAKETETQEPQPSDCPF